MRIKLVSLIVLLFSGFIRADSVARSDQVSTKAHLQSEIVSLCDLVNKPHRYKGRMIWLKAVLVENNKPRIDGADSFLYDQRCKDQGLNVVVRWSKSSHENNVAYESLNKIQKENADGFGVSRASVIIVGNFSGIRKHKYGEQGWADAEFTIDHIEEAKPVEANLPWPKWVEDLYLKAKRYYSP